MKEAVIMTKEGSINGISDYAMLHTINWKGIIKLLKQEEMFVGYSASGTLGILGVWKVIKIHIYGGYFSQGCKFIERVAFGTFEALLETGLLESVYIGCLGTVYKLKEYV